MISAEAPTLAATVMSLSPQVILNRHKQFLLIPAGNVGGSYIDFAFALQGRREFSAQRKATCDKYVGIVFLHGDTLQAT